MLTSIVLTFAVTFASAQAAQQEVANRAIAKELEAAWSKAAAVDKGNSLNPPHAYEAVMQQIEARLGLTIPERWEYAMGGRAGRKYDFVKNNGDWPHARFVEPEPFERTGLGVMAPKGVRIEKRGTNVEITSGKTSVTLPIREFSQELFVPSDACVVCLGPTRSFIALHSCPFRSFPLLCVDTQTGATLWRSTVLEEDKSFFVFLECVVLEPTPVEITANEKWVGVFAPCNVVEYFFAVFDAKTGKCLVSLPTVPKK